MKKLLLAVLLSIVIVGTGFCGGNQETSETANEPAIKGDSVTSTTEENSFEPFTFIDAFGREILISEPVEAIAIHHHIFAEFLVGIGAEDRVVAVPKGNVGDDEIFYPALSKNIIISETPGTAPDYEAIITSDAQVFLVNGLHSNREGYEMAVKKLEPHVQVLALSTQEQEDFYNTVEMLGRITACEKGASAYNKFVHDVFKQIEERVSMIAEEDKVKVYFEPMRSGWTVNDGCMGFGFQVPAAGGINIAGEDFNHDYEWFEVDKEWLALQNPDFIVMRATNPHGYEIDNFDGMVEQVNLALTRPELSQSNAVINGRVYCIADDFIRTARIFISVAYMAKLFYPDQFSDFEPQNIHQEYLKTFIGIDYDVEQHGSFVYPE